MKKQIIFLEPYPTIMIYKISKLLRKKGYKTISIRLLESKDRTFDFYSNAYDKIINFNLSFFKINIKNLPSIIFSLFQKTKSILKAFLEISKLKPYVIICRGKPYWPCALSIKFFKKFPRIFFPYDIRSEGFESLKLAKDSGLKNFEINSEKYCFENADGIIHKGAPDELEHLDGRIFKKINFQELKLNFQPYTSNEFIIPFNKNKLSKFDNELHIIQASSIGSVDPSVSSFLFDYLIELTKEKIHVHQYTQPNTLSSNEIMDSLNKKYGDKINPKYFHFHKPLNPKELIKEISKYDFGIFVPGPKKGKYHLEAAKNTGNKLASYLEAGIPYIYPPELKYIHELSKKYKIDFCFKNPKEIKKLKKLNYKEIEKRIDNARRDFNMEKNFPRFEKFIQEVVNKTL